MPTAGPESPRPVPGASDPLAALVVRLAAVPGPGSADAVPGPDAPGAATDTGCCAAITPDDELAPATRASATRSAAAGAGEVGTASVGPPGTGLAEGTGPEATTGANAAGAGPRAGPGPPGADLTG
jgi:hypothetical protein